MPFTPDRADSFGDLVLTIAVPLAKILCFPGLLPGILQRVEEYLVIGGLYRLRQVAMG